MGWFDSQIKERLEHDEDLVSQAAWDLSVAITGRAAGGAEVDAGKAAADAVGVSRTATSPPARRYASIARMLRGSRRKRTASTSPCRSESWA